MVNCCRNIKRFIKRCDFFGTFVTFRINDEIEYKSIVGGITSIIFFIVAVLYIIYVGIPFATRKNIEFIFSYKILESKPFLNLTKVRFNFGFGIHYKDDGSLQNKIEIVIKDNIAKDELVQGTYAFSSSIISISAQLKFNINVVI